MTTWTGQTRRRHLAARRPLRFTACCALALSFSTGCSAPESLPEPDGEVQGIPDVPMPPADGPKLIVTRHLTIVRDRPSHAGKPLGTLRLGAAVTRAEQPYSKTKCEGGWYPIRPRGFVCAGVNASVDPVHPALAVLGSGPRLDRALPYRYANISTGAAVSYEQVPSAEQQAAAEPKRKPRKPPEHPLAMGAVDVPLDEHGIPTGPPVLLPDAPGVDGSGQRTFAGYFDFGAAQTLPAGLTLIGDTDTRVLKDNSGVALANTVEVADGEETRRFGVMPSGRLVPVDRLEPELSTAWHGMDLSKVGLPVAFTIRNRVNLYHLEKAKATRQDDELDPRQGLALSGRFRTVNGVKYYFLTDSEMWVQARHTIFIPNRTKYPDFATPEQKWIDISLANQTLVAWQGKTPLYATLISSGRDQLGDPAEGPSTKQGVFPLKSKHVSLSLDDREVEQRHSVGDAPWVLEFEEGFWITGCYWHSRFGEPRGFHNIAMSPVDAHWLWNWVDPQLPEGWHAVMIDEKAANTIVYVHR